MSEPSWLRAGCCTANRPPPNSLKSLSGRSSGRSTSLVWSLTPGAGTTKNCSPSSTLRPSTWTTTSAPNLTASLARTPLYDRHVALGGRMVDFGGWELPQQYTSIRDEHLAVRKAAGLFDVSHMGRFRIKGDASLGFVDRLVTNDVSSLAAGHAQYSQMCNDAGGIIDDLVVYRTDEGVLVVVNASNR